MSSQAKKMHRTLLFAPGSRTELLTKAQLGAADAMIFDLEDSVPLNAKDEARKNIQQVLGLGLKKPMYLRISNPRAGDYVADLGVFHNHSLFNVAGVALPKADDAHDIETVSKALQVIEIKAGVAVGSLSILPMIETCLGLRNSFDIAKSSKRVSGMALASAEQGDFMVDLGGHWTPRSLALTYPRSKLVVDSRAAGVEWIVDGVFMNLKDTQMLREECLIARELGFVGKMAIHPTQVDVMHEVFSPSAEEIEYARGLIAAFREGEARGVGAVKYEGMMVDYANVRLAERTLALVESL
ncbi:MAG: CoA ester lyase [Betaproteobacteria bacterium]|nr:CoA ester lyase [Betaproteobacteria bacterium]NBY09111.1 CoA ester lyase [Betaproteobacteria bacterium]